MMARQENSATNAFQDSLIFRNVSLANVMASVQLAKTTESAMIAKVIRRVSSAKSKIALLPSYIYS